ncbi:FkbM family methyltransferase [Porphyrobacter sp. GA68]|uniref:FkbM family methyltransferase n=1 Tax=Porphyrobacter sp. GA68 TaxID=2883480 RepID=UPI001D18E580|nr:FkbM family methyltransferase [Porphyrobacter sp. GA68]
MLSEMLARVFDRRPIGQEETVYRRLLRRGYRPAGIVDVGAYEGEWSKLARKVWGQLPTLMIEAQEGKRSLLEDVCRHHPGLLLEIAVLGAESGRMVSFFTMETGSSIFPEQSDVPREVSCLRTRTLDEVVGADGSTDLFLKIDVQGAELEVLKGGENTLAAASLVQLETAFLSYNEGAPKIGEVISFMDERGFTPCDIAGEVRLQDCLVQIDLMFCPINSELRPDFFHFPDASRASVLQ